MGSLHAIELNLRRDTRAVQQNLGKDLQLFAAEFVPLPGYLTPFSKDHLDICRKIANAILEEFRVGTYIETKSKYLIMVKNPLSK